MLHGIDIAHDNGIDSTKYALDFGVVKSTEGTAYHNGNHPAQVEALRQAGKLVGHYHFLHSTIDGKAQADYFLAHTTLLPGDIVCLDLEQNTGTYTQRIANALLFLREVKAKTGAAPLLYSYPDYLKNLIANPVPDAVTHAKHIAELRTYPLWIAEYNGKDMVDSADMFGWSLWTMHQNADKPFVDRDVFNGDRSTWTRLAVPHPAPPTPPKPSKPVVEIIAPSTVTIKVTQK